MTTFQLSIPDLLNSDRYIENAAKRAAVFGAQESTERVALFSFEGNDYYLGFSLLRFGDHWKISEQTSPLGTTNSLGAPENTTPTAFEALTNEA